MSAPAPAATDPRAVTTPPYRRRAMRADLLSVIAWSTTALALALWLATGTADFSSAGGIVTSLGIAAGLIGTNLVLLMLLLAARIPFVDRTVGHDRALRMHRQLGKPAFYLLVAHGGLLLVGYGITDGIDPISETGVLWQAQDMPLAFLALGLFLLVVVSSLVIVRRKLPYEFWHVVHFLSYAAVLTALPHELSQGGVFTDGSAQRAYWVGLYVVTLGSIAVFRFIVPLARSLHHDVRISSIQRIGPDAYSIHFSGRDLERLNARGGQYVNWRFWTRGTWWHTHPISLSAVPTDNGMRVTLRTLGDGTRRIARLRPGTHVSFEGPYGLFSSDARTAPRMAIIAAGIGVTPVRALLEDSHLAPGEATILIRASGDDELFLWHELYRLAGERGAAIYAMTGRRAGGGRAWMSRDDADRGVTLRSVFPALDLSDVYVCGPDAWMDSVEAELRAQGVPQHRIHSERFDW